MPRPRSGSTTRYARDVLRSGQALPRDEEMVLASPNASNQDGKRGRAHPRDLGPHGCSTLLKRRSGGRRLVRRMCVACQLTRTTLCDYPAVFQIPPGSVGRVRRFRITISRRNAAETWLALAEASRLTMTRTSPIAVLGRFCIGRLKEHHSRPCEKIVASLLDSSPDARIFLSAKSCT